MTTQTNQAVIHIVANHNAITLLGISTQIGAILQLCENGTQVNLSYSAADHGVLELQFEKIKGLTETKVLSFTPPTCTVSNE